MPRQRILIFDLDGTLIDTMAELADLFCSMLQAEQGVPDEVSRTIYVELAGKGPRPQFEAVFETLGQPDPELVDDITQRYWQRAEAFEPVAFPETRDVLEQLRRDGHSLVVSSGGTTASVERKMRMTGIDRLFSLCLGTDEGVPGMRKGSGHFSSIRASLKLTDNQLVADGIFVGDSAYDMQVARDAGLVAVGRVTGDNGPSMQQAGAQHLIQDLREMHALLATL